MTNYEKYKNEIDKIARMGRRVAILRETNEIMVCDRFSNCSLCLFRNSGMTCAEQAIEWADAEYIEPEVDWSKAAVDTPILVSNNNVNWFRRHFAKYEEGLVYAWNDGHTSYTTDLTTYWEYAKLAEVE